MSEIDHPSNEFSEGVLSIDAVRARYLGEHIVMRVTGLDRLGNPINGIVVAHGVDAGIVSQQFAAIDSGPDLPLQPYCFLFGEPLIHSVEELMQTFQEG